MKKRFGIALIMCAALLTGCGVVNSQPQTTTTGTTAAVQEVEYLTGLHHAVIEVAEYGKIEVELDANIAPISVTRFVELAKDGYYDGVTFHRIMTGFMIQGGNNPERVSELKPIKGEFASNGIENTISHERGVISMARTNVKDSATAQFFIVHKDSPFLDGNYAAFGHVTAGIGVVDKICEASRPVDDNGTILPEQQPVITSITVID